MKNLTTLHGQTRDLHLDEVRQHLEFLTMQLLHLLQLGLQQSKARWLQIAPILAKGVQSGWQLVKAGRLKIFQMVERELLYLLQMGLQLFEARWLQIAPILAKGMQNGWQLIKAGWLKISQMVEREFALELEGGSADMDWAEDARKMWKEQELKVRNQGKLIHSVVSDVRKLAKLGKGGLEEEGIQLEGR
jgi:hypothetical protein